MGSTNDETKVKRELVGTKLTKFGRNHPSEPQRDKGGRKHMGEMQTK